jgi:hypothetical protein
MKVIYLSTLQVMCAVLISLIFLHLYGQRLTAVVAAAAAAAAVVLLLLLLFIIIIILHITFLQGIYNYVPETDHVSRVYSVAAVLYLQSVLCIILFCL